MCFFCILHNFVKKRIEILEMMVRGISTEYGLLFPQSKNDFLQKNKRAIMRINIFSF